MRFRSTIFAAGFFGSLLLFFAANLYSYYRMRNASVLIDAYVDFGFPFKLYMTSGFAGENILWCGLVANISIAICVGIILGLVSKKISERGWLR